MKHTYRKVTSKERLILFWGKLRRFSYHTYNTRYIRENRSCRIGECERCGACCWLGHPCPFLAFEGGGQACCKINHRKSKNCLRFPIDEKDLYDRNYILPHISCGFSFKPKDSH